MMNGNEVKMEDYVRPNLLDTAELAYELTAQDWSEIGSSNSVTDRDVADDSFGYKSIESFADDILALLLIRFLAILQSRNETSGLPNFPDLSTTTISRTIIADEARRTADPQLEKEMHSLDWPRVLNDKVVFLLRSYIIQILKLYRSVLYHNCAHAHHVFLSANKLLDMMLCEHQWQSVKEKGNNDIQSNFGILEEKQSDLEGEEDSDTMYIDNIQKIYMMEPEPKPIRPTYGIKSDPLLHLGFLFSALVHDVDHKGVSNRQLVLESDELAILYNDQSVAEQRSLAVAFTYLMKEEFMELRDILFGDREELLRFRSNVIDLVLCTDISSPERVQIVKSKFKEVFGDKKKPGHEPKRNSASSAATSRRDSNETNETENEEKEKEEKARRKKVRDSWKTTPADPELARPVQKNNLVKEFFQARSSISSFPSRNRELVKGTRDTNRLPSDEDINLSNSEDDSLSIQGALSDTALSESSDRSTESAYSTCMESEGGLSSYSSSRTKDVGREMYPGPGMRRQIQMRPGSADPRANNRRNNHTVQPMGKKAERRFTAPNFSQSRRKKFHFRLGIRRALDLTGTTIEAYDKKVKRGSSRKLCDPDRPNALRAVVVLEQMLKAADIAANMQKWETMLKWSENLFQELKVCYVKGRGDDPMFGWHENQIAFFESYALPLARSLVDTKVLEEEDARKLVRNVQENNVRWMIEGKNVTQKISVNWDAKQPKRRSVPIIRALDLSEFLNV